MGRRLSWLWQKTKNVLGKDVFRCQERNSGRDGELLPATFRFVVWGSPLSLKQESINVLGKCGVQGSVPVVENHSDGYLENIQLFRSTFDV